jgi:4-hydroxybenzoyl-CoA reductase subunit beta
LREVREFSDTADGAGLAVGAGVTLTDLAGDPRVKSRYPGLYQAASQVATPHIQNMATLGGNLCLDTRCNYYDQNHEWRQAIGFCMKKEGETCWVAPGSDRCLAVSSTDTAPMLIALGARVTLVSKKDGERTLPLADLYRNDGIHYLTRRPDEILTAVHLDDAAGWKSVYWKLRRRGSFDFPVLSVAAAVKTAKDGAVEDARIVLGAAASRPVPAERAAKALLGQPLTDAAIAKAAGLAYADAKPMDNTDFVLHWRKRVTREFTTFALRELRGDDLGDARRRYGRQDLVQIA